MPRPPATPTPKRDYADLAKTLLEHSLRPRPQTDAELIERITEYIDYCHANEYNMNFQALVTYCGLTIQEVRDIVNRTNNSIVGGAAAEILTKAGELLTAIDLLRVGDGTHKSANMVMFDKKQPNPGGGYMDTPPIAVITPDLLSGGADRKALREQYRDYLEQRERKIIDVTPEESDD